MSSNNLQLIFLVTTLLVLSSSSHGLGRKLMKTGSQDEEHGLTAPGEGNGGRDVSREMIELDYVDVGPNTNTHSAFTPPTPVMAPTPSP